MLGEDVLLSMTLLEGGHVGRLDASDLSKRGKEGGGERRKLVLAMRGSIDGGER